MAKSAAAVKSTPAPAAPAASHLSFVDVDESKLHLSETYTISDYKKDMAKAADKLSSACRVAFATLGGDEKEAVAAYVADKWGESLELKNYTKGSKLGQIQKANPSYYQAITGAYKKVFGAEAAPPKDNVAVAVAVAPFDFAKVEAVLKAFDNDTAKAVEAVEALSKIGDLATIKQHLDKAAKGIEAVGSLESLKKVATILAK